MPIKAESEDFLHSLGAKIAGTKRDAMEGILNLYGKSNRPSIDESPATPEPGHARASTVLQAFAYEDYPDPALESARTTTITKGPIIVKTIGTPPKRPPRPDSWMRGGTTDPWSNVSLADDPSEQNAQDNSHQNVSTASAQGPYFVRNIAQVEERSDESINSLEKVPDVDSPQPPKFQRRVGFWHSNIQKPRREALTRWAMMTLLLSVFLLGIFSLYWAIVMSVDKHISSLTVFVVDFEFQTDALVGPVVRNVTEGIVRDNKEPHLGFLTVAPSKFNSSPLAVREAIWEEQAWAAIVVNSNATRLLRQAMFFANTTYDPNGAIQILYNEAREQDLYFNHIYPMMQNVQAQILDEFGRKWTTEVMLNGAISRINMGLVPQAINPGIGFSTFNIRPFLPRAAIPAVSTGLIYLVIICFCSFGFYLPIHRSLLKGTDQGKIKTWQFILWRLMSTLMAYVFLSLAYSLISVAFGFPFGNSPGSHLMSETAASKFYGATFLVYWIINFFGMISLGLVCENMAMFLGPQWAPLWLVFWIISNVTTAYYGIHVDSDFYRWGYIWPLHNIVEASRTTLFDLRSNLGVNFGVLILWGFVNTAAFPFGCLYSEWKAVRDMKKKQ